MKIQESHLVKHENGESKDCQITFPCCATASEKPDCRKGVDRLDGAPQLVADRPEEKLLMIVRWNWIKKRPTFALYVE
jgi:hypothetical protein